MKPDRAADADHGHYSYTAYADPAMAQSFDKRRFSGPIGELVATTQARVLANMVGRIQHRRLLDVGTGTGRAALILAAGGAKVTGVDASEEMLAIARQRAAGLGRDVDLREGDAEHLPFDDASFDTVVCAFSLCTIPSPDAAIAEMRRVLGPGGRLLLLDHIGSTWPPVYVAQWLLERITIRTAGEHFTRRQLPLVKAAGFQIVETERLKTGTVERVHAVKPAAAPER